jgi:hypothetical protein
VTLLYARWATLIVALADPLLIAVALMMMIITG